MLWNCLDPTRLQSRSTKTISLRMPAALLETIKIEANKRDVPYQSLIKMTLADQFQNHPAGS